MLQGSLGGDVVFIPCLYKPITQLMQFVVFTDYTLTDKLHICNIYVCVKRKDIFR